MVRRSLALALVTATLAGCGDADPKKPAPPATPDANKPVGGYAAGGYGYAAALGTDLDKRAGDAVGKGRKFLLSKRNESNGSWGAPEQVPVGFTAFATHALIGSTARESVASDPVILAGLRFVAAKQRPNGSIVSAERFANYETSAAISAFAAARASEFAEAQRKASEYLVASQVKGDESSASYGGFPYESKSDPGAPVDLSNAQHALTAAHDAAVADKQFWDRAVVYLGRVQNRSETNTLSVSMKEGDKPVEVVSGNDGGAGYAPGRSKAGYVERPDGKREPRSYGSMTYALLKCLLFSGAKADDPRVAAAVTWLSKNFTVERNPGFEADKDPAKAGQQGYYYYLLTMARALAEYEKATGKALAVTDAAGKAHEWRKEVAAKLVSLQKADGSWVNAVERWEEADPVLATSYALQTLATCQGRLP